VPVHDSVGVLLVNLGSPEAPTRPALRRYLREFLSDPRVVDKPRYLWLPILHLIILNIRPSRSAKLYRKIWSRDGSPLLVISEQQRLQLESLLQRRHGGKIRVALAMRYGRPSIGKELAGLLSAGCRHLLVLPLFPQYSSATTASVFDAVGAALNSRRDLPEIRFVHDYHDHPAYIKALAAGVRETWAQGGEAEKLLFSFHGIPARYCHEGDPYPRQCRHTAVLLAAELGLEESRWQLCFQSRFGAEKWLQPYTDETLIRLARDGIKQVDVVCPGFAGDCLETLEEIAMENRQAFLHAGGEQFRYIPALNARRDHIQTLAEIAERHCCGWLSEDRVS